MRFISEAGDQDADVKSVGSDADPNTSFIQKLPVSCAISRKQTAKKLQKKTIKETQLVKEFKELSLVNHASKQAKPVNSKAT